MESIPTAFVDAVCATLLKEDLKILQDIGEPWTSTVTTHYSRRREFDVYLAANPAETEVAIGVSEYGRWTYGNVASLSTNDRIRLILAGAANYAALPEKMPMERFRTKVLPLLNFGLRAPALNIKTGCFGGNCIEFVEQQIAFGQLEELTLYGKEWPDSLKAPLKSFLKFPNFVKLDVIGSDLTVDLDMLTCIVERFLKGELREDTLLVGKPSEEMRDLHFKSVRGYSLPLLDGLSTRPQTCRFDNNMIFWRRPDLKELFVLFSGSSFVQITQH
uniref:FBA_2 domain-containing protein n=1 Tax=Steinernema glaseri TaxID=37863 RepID=A0A1I7XVI9_9BILA